MTLKVNIAIGDPDLNWIAGRFARELVARLPTYGVEAFINDTVRGHALEFQSIVYGPPTRRPAVGFFTHGDFRPRRYARDYDGHIVFNPAMIPYLVEGGADRSTITVIEPCVDTDRFNRRARPIIFGVAGRTYPDGRKGEHLVRALVDHGYNVVAWGSGWPCEIFSSDLADLPAFYRAIDYYIDTAHDEGGCMAAFEAIAMGVPVISHTVGVLHPVIPYERSDVNSLLNVVCRLTAPRSYDDFARDHAVVFHETAAMCGISTRT